MRHFITAAAIGLAAIAIPATSFASGTTAPKTVHTYDVVSGNYATKPLAQARLTKLDKAGFTGFKVVEMNKHFLDVWGPATLGHSKTEQHRLLTKKFRSSITKVS
jgi:hypothetical protein